MWQERLCDEQVVKVDINPMEKDWKTLPGFVWISVPLLVMVEGL